MTGVNGPVGDVYDAMGERPKVAAPVDVLAFFDVIEDIRGDALQLAGASSIGGDAEAARRAMRRLADKLEASGATRAAVAAMRAALYRLCETVEEPPERNCSCHLSPPCNDCVDWSGLREALAEGRAALARIGGAP